METRVKDKDKKQQRSRRGYEREYGMDKKVD